MYKPYLILLMACCTTLGWSQEKWKNPLEFPLYLAGNFGELRANHFHSGIDMKTQGVTGKAVHAVQDGYVSRLSVRGDTETPCICLIPTERRLFTGISIISFRR